MSLKVPRMCVEIGSHDSSPLPRHLDEFREAYAYVLLGEPGAGKTTAFKQEAAETDGCYVTARDFVTFDGKPEWSQTTLFIDGLDEIRAGVPDRLTPLDNIRRKIDQFAPPKFRLSCRMVDWLGTSDRSSLETLSKGDKNIRVLGLEPLSSEDVEAILKEQPSVVNAKAFIDSARQNGLDHLLCNPQSLEMLALAIAESGGRWPEDRKQAFNLACRKLLEEGNPDRRSRRLRAVSEPDLLTAAGKLFAVQLLTGSTGYRLDGGGEHEGFLPLNQISGEDQNTLCDVIDSKLFWGPQEGRAEPYHRHIAEFLGAAYLAKHIKAELPVARILALTTGCDGGVVPEFRGLLAWLAAHSPIARDELIERDPYGVVEYGCTQEFSTDEKRRILVGLEHETQTNPWFGYMLSRDHRLGDLASADMKEVFLECFAIPKPDDTQQSFALICLQALTSRTDLSGISDLALKILKNHTWGLPARREALKLFFQQTANNEQRVEQLLELLKAVKDGDIFDPHDDLQGRLLKEVYPAILPPSRILDYLRPSKRKRYFGPYCHFWTRWIVEQSTKKQLGELLDLLAERHNYSSTEFSRIFGRFDHLSNLPSRWLEYYLKDFQEEPSLRRLFHWLEFIRDDRRNTYSKEVGAWLSNHPKTLLKIYGLGIEQCGDPDRFNLCMYNARERLSGAKLPGNFGLWCLKQAVGTTNFKVAQYLVRASTDCLHGHFCNDGLSLEVIQNRLATKPDLFETFTKRQEDATSDDLLTEQHRDRYDSELLERQQKWRAQLKPMEEDLRANRCHSNVLYDLAVAYYGGYRDVSGNTPRKRLENLIGKDKSLVAAILQAFRMSIDREDLPSVKEVIRLGSKNQTHLLSYPYMAGLNEISETSRNGDISVNEEQMRLALAIYYTVPLWPLASHTEDETPQWFPSMLRSRADIVSDILVKAIRRKFHTNAEFVSGLHELAYSPDYSEVARMASLPLLKAFPVRCSKQRLQDLNYLLFAAILHCEKEPFLDLIGRKLSCHSMHVGQRVRWLAAGLFVAPEKHLNELASYVTGNEHRTRCLAEIMTSKFLDAMPDSPSIPVLSLLIRLLGTSYGPHYYDDSSTDGCRVTLDMDAAHSIKFFCERLAQIPAQEATLALESLLVDEALHTWHSNLTNLIYEQKILRREAEFDHANFGEILNVLENARPANSTDLAAVAAMKLDEVAKDIHDGDTSGWRAYWTNEKGNPTPQHEDFCKHRLLDKLKPLLIPLDIEAQQESHYANKKRPDIRFSCNGFNVPVEIKKSNNRNLWTAIKDQLILRYARDPGADGNGIYIALWFGKKFCKVTEFGTYPENANQLKQCLLETLSEEEKRKIKICVIDVSWQS